MKFQKYYRYRIFLLMLALGLASVPFFKSLQTEYTIASVALPQTDSGTLVVFPNLEKEWSPYGGGSGPDGSDEPLITINTLGSETKPYIVKNADVQKISLQNADLSFAEIENSDFSEANLRKADFSKASVYYSTFIDADLRNTNFAGARLFGSDLAEANLSNAKLKRANFAASDFSNALLTNADLTDTNLSDAELVSAKGLTFAQISKALINEFTTLPAQFEPRKEMLVKRSIERMKQLKKELPPAELELFANEFDFLDAANR
ncbi:MAG TPA: pentapeptide repeat-containing protein [Pyrinomonadaceae bacterium]|nr:pentapeptide repeat-containing protein [Pyrinomonadaceae bacterium]